MQETRSELRRLRDLQHQARVIRRQRIPILNPVAGGNTNIPLEAAVRHVARGAANWVDTPAGRAVEFVDHVRIKAEANAASDRLVHSSVASPAMIAALPCVRPGDLLAPSPRRRFGSIKAVYSDLRTSPQRLRR